MASAWSGLVRSYPEVPLATACLLLLAFVYHQTSRRSATPTNWPILGMLPGLVANLGHFHDWLASVLRESGCTFEFRGPWLLGMDFLITCDPANVNHVFNVNFSNYPKGQEFLEIFEILGDGIFNADHESWKIQRRLAHGVMSGPGFRAFVAERSRDKVEGSLVPLMAKLARKGDAVDLQDVFLRLTFDMTCELVFGVDPGCMSEGFPTIPFARAMDDAMEALFFRHVVPPPCWRLMRLLQIGKERKLAEAWRVIDQFVAESAVRNRESKACSKGLLSCYIEEESSKGGESKPIDDKFLRDTAVNLMLAGRDTTGVALGWFFWLLAKHPEVKSKILEELNAQEEIAKLVYLHAALCESLRLYPPVPAEHKGQAEAEALPSGHMAKRNQKIVFSIYAMGRMEGVWGEDCSEFRPERWITERGRLRHEPAYKFLSFNCGPRTCLGKDIAFTQMKTVAASMVRNFDVELVEGHVVVYKPSKSDVIWNGEEGEVDQGNTSWPEFVPTSGPDKTRKMDYIRYGGHFLIGVRGPRADAAVLRKDLIEFCDQRYQLKLDNEGLPIEHITKGIMFLDHVLCRRVVYPTLRYTATGGKIISEKGVGTLLSVTASLKQCIKQFRKLEFLKGDRDPDPQPCFRMFHATQAHTNAQMNKFLSTMVEWYRYADNRKKIVNFCSYIIRGSLAKLYAAKYKLRSRAKVYKIASRNLSRPLKEKKGLSPEYTNLLRMGLVDSVDGLQFTRMSLVPEADYTPFPRYWRPDHEKVLMEYIMLEDPKTLEGQRNCLREEGLITPQDYVSMFVWNYKRNALMLPPLGDKDTQRAKEELLDSGMNENRIADEEEKGGVMHSAQLCGH